MSISTSLGALPGHWVTDEEACKYWPACATLMDALTFCVEETKTGVPLELPITRQIAAILERRRTAAADLPEGVRAWVFPSPTSATGHVQDPHHLYARICKAGGAKF